MKKTIKKQSWSFLIGWSVGQFNPVKRIKHGKHWFIDMAESNLQSLFLYPRLLKWQYTMRASHTLKNSTTVDFFFSKFVNWRGEKNQGFESFLRKDTNRNWSLALFKNIFCAGIWHKKFLCSSHFSHVFLLRRSVRHQRGLRHIGGPLQIPHFR